MGTSTVRPELKGPPSQKCIDWVMAHVDLAAAERGACAVVADNTSAKGLVQSYREGWYDAACTIAAAIRARGTDEPTQD